jgi:hypothetical protein
MAVQTFTSGQVLTAADTNTYLANSGLVYVKEQTVGTGVSSVTVTNAFSSTYDNYKIIYSGGSGSTSQAISMKLGASAASYNQTLMYANYAGAFTSGGVSAGSSWTFIGESSASLNTVNIDILSPFNTYFTRFNGVYVGTIAGVVAGYHGVATSYSDFTFAVAGTLSGGTITVYGYRKA